MYLSVNDIDPETGFPVLPANHYWKVKYAIGKDMFWVMIRKRIFWIFSKEVASGLAQQRTTSSVREAGFSAVREWNKNIDAEDLRGTYPPKKLVYNAPQR